MSSWWARPISFIIFFAFCGLAGIAFIIASAYMVSSNIAFPILQGFGIALVTTAAVAAPITLYGNTLFMSQFKELTVDKLLEMRLAPELVKILRVESFDVDRYEEFKWKISFDAMPGNDSFLKILARRDYKIRNATYRPRILRVSHSADVLVGQPEGFIPGYRGISLSIVSVEDSNDKTELRFDATGREGLVGKLRGSPITVTRDKHAVMLGCEIELPPRSLLVASIASESVVGVTGTEPYICDRPAVAVEVTVTHQPWLDIGILALNNISGDSVDPINTGSPDQAGRVEETWIFNQGFFPGHGIQLRWGPSRPLRSNALPGDI
jgi:hypothetical protein